MPREGLVDQRLTRCDEPNPDRLAVGSRGYVAPEDSQRALRGRPWKRDGHQLQSTFSHVRECRESVFRVCEGSNDDETGFDRVARGADRCIRVPGKFLCGHTANRSPWCSGEKAAPRGRVPPGGRRAARTNKDTIGRDNRRKHSETPGLWQVKMKSRVSRRFKENPFFVPPRTSRRSHRAYLSWLPDSYSVPGAHALHSCCHPRASTKTAQGNYSMPRSRRTD